MFVLYTGHASSRRLLLPTAVSSVFFRLKVDTPSALLSDVRLLRKEFIVLLMRLQTTESAVCHYSDGDITNSETTATQPATGESQGRCSVNIKALGYMKSFVTYRKVELSKILYISDFENSYQLIEA